MAKRVIQVKKQIQRESSNQTLRILRLAFRVIPRWIIYPIMHVLFFIASHTTEKLQRICRNNLRFVYGSAKSDGEYKQMGRTCLKNIGYSMLDLLYYVERPRKLEKKVVMHGETHLQDVLENGRGALCISGHLGNFPLLFVALILRGYKVNVIIRPMRNRGFSRFMFSLCDVWGINMIQTQPRKNFLRETLRSLKRNELLFILFDEIPNDEGVDVEFFGQTVQRARGPVMFHERTGAAMVNVFTHKDTQGMFHINIEPAIKSALAPGTAEFESDIIRQLTRSIEDQIRRHPEQWGGWFNKRWQTRQADPAQASR